MLQAKPTAWWTSFRKRWEIMSWSTRGPRASFPWGETRKRYFPFIPQWHMPILLFLFPSARPQLCLKNKDITAQLQEPHPRLAYAVSYCSIRRVSLRRERTRNAGTWALISARPKRTPSLLGFAYTGGKIHPQPTATLTGQKAKPQRELCLAKIHPWPKDRPLGTFLPLWYLKKKKRQKAETRWWAAKDSLNAAGMSQAGICRGASSAALPPTHACMGWGFSYHCPPSLTATSLVN